MKVFLYNLLVEQAYGPPDCGPSVLGRVTSALALSLVTLSAIVLRYTSDVVQKQSFEKLAAEVDSITAKANLVN